MVPRITKLLY